MSGVCGILRFDGNPVRQRDLDRQMRAMAHLGPDGARSRCDRSVGLGHLALRVTREDFLDSQPLADSDVLLVADLRLDNRTELAADLAIDDVPLAKLPDSALLLAAYRRWGADCVHHLLGDFAFAVWDGVSGKLVLGRDHMGQRHIYFHQGRDFFAFATEIKGLWALPDVPRALSETEIGRLLLGERARPPGSTRFQGIQAVPGGTVIGVTADGAVTRQRYWEPAPASIHLGRDETYYREAYRAVLGEAVACRLRRATRPAGLLFSGGFDSAAIAALAAPALQGRKLVAAASVLPDGSSGARGDARRWVEICVRHMPHLDLRCVTREDSSILSGMERGFLSTDGPHSPNRYVRDALYRAVAATGARVVLDGHGGDYTLNPRGNAFLARFLATGRLRRFLAEFAAQRRFRREPLWRSVKRDILANFAPRGLVRAWRRARSGLDAVGPTLPVSRDFAGAAMADGIVPFGERPGPHVTDTRAVIEAALRRMQDGAAMGGSIAAAAQGLEFTQPFHDKRVVELALAIPEDLYFRDGRSRYLARTALVDLYPPEFRQRLPGNDDLTPDFMAMAKRVEPEILAEIDRMAESGKLSRYFDFQKMRKMLVQQRSSGRNPRLEYRTRQAMLGFLYARYVEWFTRGND
jgi:asparagine synthase (glutamine-hydrolysing)